MPEAIPKGIVIKAGTAGKTPMIEAIPKAKERLASLLDSLSIRAFIFCWSSDYKLAQAVGKINT
jgi:hypothetical protein